MPQQTEQSGAGSHRDPILSAALSEMEQEGALGGDGGDGAADDQQGNQGGAEDQGATDQTDQSGAGDAAADDQGDGSQAAGGSGAAQDGSGDPLKDLQPYEYTGADGQTRRLEGVFRIPGEGVVIPEDQVGVIQQLAERAESLDRSSRQLVEQAEQFDRISEWQIDGENGQPQTLVGIQGVAALRVSHAKLEAAFETLVSALRDPQSMARLVRLANKETGELALDQVALDALITASELAETKAEQRTLAQLSQRLAGTGAASAGASGGVPEAQAIQVIEAAARQGNYDPKLLTAEDRKLLAQHLPRYVRKVTAEDRRTNPSLQIGQPIVDAAFADLVKAQAGSRQQAIEKAKAAEKAGRHNAGMDKGRVKPPVRKPAAKPAASTQDSGKSERRKPDWDSPLKTALAEMNISR